MFGRHLNLVIEITEKQIIKKVYKHINKYKTLNTVIDKQNDINKVHL